MGLNDVLNLITYNLTLTETKLAFLKEVSFLQSSFFSIHLPCDYTFNYQVYYALFVSDGKYHVESDKLICPLIISLSGSFRPPTSGHFYSYYVNLKPVLVVWFLFWLFGFCFTVKYNNYVWTEMFLIVKHHL